MTNQELGTTCIMLCYAALQSFKMGSFHLIPYAYYTPFLSSSAQRMAYRLHFFFFRAFFLSFLPTDSSLIFFPLRNGNSDGDQDTNCESSRSLALARGGGYLHWQESYRQFLDQDHREAIAQAAAKANEEAARRAPEKASSTTTTTTAAGATETSEAFAVDSSTLSSHKTSHLPSSSDRSVWCPICAAPVPRQASLKAHLTTCAPKAAANAPLCPTCRWPVTHGITYT